MHSRKIQHEAHEWLRSNISTIIYKFEDTIQQHIKSSDYATSDYCIDTMCVYILRDIQSSVEISFDEDTISTNNEIEMRIFDSIMYDLYASAVIASHNLNPSSEDYKQTQDIIKFTHLVSTDYIDDMNEMD